MADKSYILDEGTVIILDCIADITAATVFQIKVKKPDNTEVVWVGTISGTTKIQYTTAAVDFDQAGEYKLQAYIETPSGKWRGETVTFRVYNNFD